MVKRALQIALAAYLVLGVSGLVPVISEAIAAAHGDCCSDCDDPGCPEQEGQECPPQCDDCVCPCWVAPLIVAGRSAPLLSPPPQAVAYLVGETPHEQPVLRGVFRPPRLSA